jgi:DNA modification methylase
MLAPAPVHPEPLVHLGDCVEWLQSLAPNSVDAIVTDPPYGLGFMGKAWDALPPGREWAEACLRVLKPGGHLVAFGGTRTVHRLTVAIEDAGFEIRDSIGWVYYSGFPKSLDVSKALDFRRDDTLEVRVVCRWLRARIDEHPTETVKTIAARFGVHTRMVDHWAARDSDSQPSLPTMEQWAALRDVLGFGGDMDARVAELSARKGTAENERPDRETAPLDGVTTYGGGRRTVVSVGSPVTPDAERWSGWGTALKPAIEPAVLARKPLDGTVASNVLRWGTGALNIDACRFAPGDPAWVGPDDGTLPTQHGAAGGENGLLGTSTFRIHDRPPGQTAGQLHGRWPANVYYCPKAPRKERERGCDGLPTRSGAEAVDREEDSAGTRSPRAGAGRTASSVRNHHPTVKPVRLMRWLIRLVTPPGGLVLDPFLGSGTTGIAALLEGVRFAGAEREAEYHAIAQARMDHALRHPEQWADGARPVRRPRVVRPDPAQRSLFGGGR